MSPKLAFLRHSLNYLWLVAAAVYLSISAAQAVSRNYSSKQELARLEAQLVELEVEKTRLEALLVYLQTDSYKEKELRRALLLVKPGEKVYALPESAHPQSLEEAASGTVVAVTPETEAAQSQPIWRQWVEYLF